MLIVTGALAVTVLDIAMGRPVGLVEPGAYSPVPTTLLVSTSATIPGSSMPGTTTTTTSTPRSATLLFTGDLLAHSAVTRAAARNADDGLDFRPMFEEVAPRIARADLAICHLETPLSRTNSDLGRYPIFNAPPALAEAAAVAGYDGCSTASNHAYDRKPDGFDATISVLESVGLGQAGLARSADEDRRPVLHEAGGITVGHIAATYWLNGFRLPDGEQYLVDVIEPRQILNEARAARMAGTEFVVVSLHWDLGYIVEPTQDQQDWLAAILPSPHVDMVVGHHAHVPQPAERLDGEWVLFGIGNFLTGQGSSCCPAATQDGLIVEVDLHEPEPGLVQVARVRYTPTYVRRPDYVIVPVMAWLERENQRRPPSRTQALTCTDHFSLRIQARSRGRSRPRSAPGRGTSGTGSQRSATRPPLNADRRLPTESPTS